MVASTLTPQTFIAKWKKAKLSERSSAQQHFLDLCELLGHPKPADADPRGEWYTFEAGVRMTDGENGWADVWKQGYFAWEYKRKHKDLREAYRQLLKYREYLENPPLLVVCDTDRFEAHTNFTGTAKQIYGFGLDGLAEPANLDTLRKVFTDPGALKPGQTKETVTEAVAGRFAMLAFGMRDRGVPVHAASRFLMKLIFCMFAQSIDLLPDKLFTRILTKWHNSPAKLSERLHELFEAMATGAEYGADPILYFNGGLFADAGVVTLTEDEIGELMSVSRCDWGSIEPSIFGTLFERTINPSKGEQVGARYTGRNDIEALLKPVLLAPLLQDWDEVKGQCDQLWLEVQEGVRQHKGRRRIKDSKARRKHDHLLLDFVQRLADKTVLDAACGSGNFLYVAIHFLLDLEKRAIAYAANHSTSVTPHVSPAQLHGIERNSFAQELAQVAIWIGHLQWKYQTAFHRQLTPYWTPSRAFDSGTQF